MAKFNGFLIRFGASNSVIVSTPQPGHLFKWKIIRFCVLSTDQVRSGVGPLHRILQSNRNAIVGAIARFRIKRGGTC